MNKKETLEIRKQFTNENCAITRICGCYVDAEKQIRTELKEAFLSLPEEEIFKYYEIFRKISFWNYRKKSAQHGISSCSGNARRHSELAFETP